ncbi:MAG: hypothetical protein PHG00_08490 [Methylococcales bacterium]|nr:hypothetical protein [Methylococcales bacterium]
MKLPFPRLVEGLFAERELLMPKAYSMDSRKRVIEACDEGQTIAQVVERFRVSTWFVEKLQQRRRESGTWVPKPHGGGRQPLLTSAHNETLRTLLTVQPDLTLEALRAQLGVKVHLSTLGYRLQRDAWQQAQPLLNPAKLVFIDETGFDTALVRRYGWGVCGARVRGSSLQGYWHTSTFVAALRQQGLTAPMVIQEGMDGAFFKAYVQGPLSDALARRYRGLGQPVLASGRGCP